VRSRVAALATFAAALALLASCGSSAPRLVAIGGGLSGPKGLHATVYAKGPSKVAAFAFDSAGRLWLATADYTDEGKDGLYLVAKRGAKPVEVVSHLHTPLGLLWNDDTLYVASTGRVDAFSNLTAPCDHCTPKSKLSAAIVSFRTDGSDLRIYASGIRAPVGLEFYPGTSDLLVTMNQRDDLGSRTPGDWLALVAAGQNWKFPNCYGQSGALCAGVPKPVAVLDKHAAASDVAIVTGQLGSTVGTSALVAEWAKNAVLRVALDRKGSAIHGRTKTFLTGIQNPVALTLTKRGALLVGDWTSGTIYMITSPTSNP
jgi:Glucose / Sorbosone dehydrogenase